MCIFLVVFFSFGFAQHERSVSVIIGYGTYRVGHETQHTVHLFAITVQHKLYEAQPMMEENRWLVREYGGGVRLCVFVCSLHKQRMKNDRFRANEESVFLWSYGKKSAGSFPFSLLCVLIYFGANF